MIPVTRFVFILMFLFSAPAVAAKCRNHGKRYLKVLEANKQQTISGVTSDDKVFTETFVIVLKKKVDIKSFFWRAKIGVAGCKVEKVHSIPPGTRDVPRGMKYSIETCVASDFRPGDTLLFTVLNFGNYAYPADVYPDIYDALFFLGRRDRWHYVQISDIKVTRPLYMP